MMAVLPTSGLIPMAVLAMLGGAIVGSALVVVTRRNAVSAVAWLVVHFVATAGAYIFLNSQFIAAVQVLVYAGAVMVLFLFGIMLTRAQIGKEEGLNNTGWQLGIPVALLLFGLMAYVIVDTFKDQVITEVTPFPTEGIADQVLSPFLVPFLAISFVLLAAAIGAIIGSLRSPSRKAFNCFAR